jgi:hypothetical protein
MGSEMLTNSGFDVVPTLGSELITNGGFATDTDWTKGTGWTIASGVASKAAGSATLLSIPISLTPGATYAVGLTVSNLTSTIIPRFSGGSNVSGGTLNANGTTLYYMTAVAGNDTFSLVATATTVADIDNVTVKEVTNYSSSAWRPVAGGGAHTFATGNVTLTDVGGLDAQIQHWDLSLDANTTYVLVITISTVNVSGQCNFRIGTSTGSSTNVLNAAQTISAPTTITNYFTTTVATTTGVVGVLASGTNASVVVDSISLKAVNLTAAGATRGSELLTNGTFTGSATGWTLGNTGGTASAAYGSNAVTLAGDGTNSGYADQSFTTVSGTTYEVTTPTATSGGLLSVGTSAGGAQHISALAFTSNASTVIFTATGTTTWIRLYKTTSGNSSVDNVSVKAVTAVGTYPKRSATFAEFFAYTAASTTARTYIENGGTLRNMEYNQNLVLQSQTFDSATWTKSSNTAITANSTTAPDGTTTADTLTHSASGQYYLQQNPTLPIDRVVMSCYAKANTTNYFLMDINTGGTYAYAVFELTGSGTMTQSASFGYTLHSTAISSEGSGWYRCQMIVTITNAPSYLLQAVNSGTPTVPSFGLANVVNGNSVYIWGAQCEPGTAISSYKATTTATSGVNAPRFTWINGKRQLRLENAGTNLCRQSENLTTTPWSTGSLTVTANSIAAPDGNTTADTLTATGASGFVYDTGETVTSGQTYTASLYAKAGTVSYLSFSYGSGANISHRTFHLSGSGAISNTGYDAGHTGQSATITALANGWYRCTLTSTVNATSAGHILGPASTSTPVINSNGINTNTANGNTVYVWGAQLENSAFATDYIPTTTASVTRAIETCRLSPEIEGILLRSAGSVVVRCDVSQPFNSNYPYLIGQGSNSGFIRSRGDSSATISTRGVGGVEFSATLGSGSNRDALGAAMGFDAGGRSLSGNGGTVATDTTQPDVRTIVYLGRDTGPSFYGDGYYDFIGGSPERLPDVTLQTLAVAA